jgi:hypothetical protein
LAPALRAAGLLIEVTERFLEAHREQVFFALTQQLPKRPPVTLPATSRKACWRDLLQLRAPFHQPELTEKLHLVEVEPVASDDAIFDCRDIAGAYPHGFAGGRNGFPRGVL